MATLARNVIVDGVGYGPGFGNAADVPADIAAKITNPAAWDGDEAPKPTRKRAPKSKPAADPEVSAAITEGAAEPDPFGDLT